MDDPIYVRSFTFPGKPLNSPTVPSVFGYLREDAGIFLKGLTRIGVTKQIRWEEYRQDNPVGYGHSQFCERLRRWEKASNVSLSIEYKLTDTFMIVFARNKYYFVGKLANETIHCQVLICVLPFSGYSYVETLPKASLLQLVKGPNNCEIGRAHV